MTKQLFLSSMDCNYDYKLKKFGVDFRHHSNHQNYVVHTHITDCYPLY